MQQLYSGPTLSLRSHPEVQYADLWGQANFLTQMGHFREAADLYIQILAKLPSRSESNVLYP